MKTYLNTDIVRYRTLSARELRDSFLLEALHVPGELHLAYIESDRAVAGFAVPKEKPLALPAPPQLRANFFLERREIGALNIGGPGAIVADGQTYSLDHLDCLYLGRGVRNIEFSSQDAENPARFYLLSYPAHAAHPTMLVLKADASPMDLGSQENANQRTVYKYIHMAGAQSCQLVMGVTHLQSGNVWNTMPPHTHLRRSEIYMYFNVGDQDRVVHFMGAPDDTRHIMVANHGVVVSPVWSIHAGAGTRAYSFCWGMGGENQDYADMDVLQITELL